jgi:hypothetical protein
MMTAPLESTIDDSLPARRRFVFGRTAMALAAALVLTLGFIGGVEVQKHQATTAAAGATSTASSGLAAGGFAPGGFPGTGTPADVTTGTVVNKKGSYVYVKDADGNVLRVKTSSQSTITRNTKTSTAAIHPGDTVLVQGPKNKTGTITATRLTATAKGVAPAGSGGRFGGGVSRATRPNGQ